MYRYFRKETKRLFGDIEEVLVGCGIYKSSDYVRLANEIDWDSLCAPLEQVYSMNTGRASINVRWMLALEMLKHMMNVSDKEIVRQLQTNLEVKYFCGVTNIFESTKIEPSSLTHFRNRLSDHQDVIDAIQNIHLKSMVAKLPKKKQAQYDQDSTVINEKIKYPHDIELLNDVVQSGAKLIKTMKNAGVKQFEGMVAKGKQLAKKLHLAYNFSRGKAKMGLDETRKIMIKHTEKITKEIEKGYKKFKHIKDAVSQKISKQKEILKDYLGVAKEIISQQKELLKEGVKTVKERIVSYKKTYIRTIVKGKKGRKFQFGAKAQVGMIGGKVAVAVGHTWENEHDSKWIEEGVKKVEKVRGKPPSEFGYDKGGRGKEAYEYLEEKGIQNAIQGSPDRKKLTKPQRKRLYKRRAFNECIINDVLNNRGVNNNLYGKKNVGWSLIMGCMASNMIRVR